MTNRNTLLSSIRFGYGQRPDAPALGPDEFLARLSQPDRIEAQRNPADLNTRAKMLRAYADMRRAARKGKKRVETMRQAKTPLRELAARDFMTGIIRPMMSDNGFRERLVSFWADHFTVSAKSPQLLTLYGDYQNAAIRPHIAGRFVDMLKAVIRHPAMLIYLDQTISVGPNSRIGQRAGRGLNENLARELLELHTLGVSAAYSQADVTQLAELLTGLRVTPNGFRYNPSLAEPGAEVVLGTSYGGGAPRMADIDAALDDLALHPDTAGHLARKLAVHFISDTPDEGLIAAMRDAYLSADGDLMALYAAMLDHPASWGETLEKIKPPFDYMVSSLRALSIMPGDLDTLNRRDIRNGVTQPLTAMGQTPLRPPGPDGWPESQDAWITPALLTARIEWSAALARLFGENIDPRQFLETTLGDLASRNLKFAAAGAETRWEGVAVVLASPEFNRR